MKLFIRCLFSLVILVALCSCSKNYPEDSSQVKYVNRGSPGARVSFDNNLFVPDKMNILYFYADW